VERNPLKSIEIIPISGIGDIAKGDDLGRAILLGCRKSKVQLRKDDIVVVTHKIVSKSEGQLVKLDDVVSSEFAKKSGKHVGKDPRQVEVILSESRRVLKMVRGLIISETHHGFVCANAGVDQSNVEKGKIVLLPKRPDESARKLRASLRSMTGKRIAVIISDTFGRPWREGQINVAIGCSGLKPFSDYRGRTDQYGYELHATVICVADELASAGELCMNKLDRVPVVVIRGYSFAASEDARARLIPRKPSRDLFR
jgi:coenzyme F420-0:L-glutamate ligase / coenzyme F420-1:gamma-L-glutamate ligase